MNGVHINMKLKMNVQNSRLTTLHTVYYH